MNIDSDSLAFVSFSDNGRRLQLDYGACNFDSAGHPLNYMTAATDQVLTSVEYARAQEHGFRRIFEYPVPKDLAMTRFVVRDRATGNLGSIDVLFPWADGTPHSDPLQESALHKSERLRAERVFSNHNLPPEGPLGSFGSVVPNPLSMCADVYELETGTLVLPDFRTLDPIGSLYTDFLDVPNQLSSPTCGVPGATCRTEYFGLDYHGEFWVSTPGSYEFELISDDGAKLQIDDTILINVDGTHGALSEKGRISLDVGRHTIHVPYFEGFPVALALELWVKPPGKKWSIFNIRDYPPPGGVTASGSSVVK